MVCTRSPLNDKHGSSQSIVASVITAVSSCLTCGAHIAAVLGLRSAGYPPYGSGVSSRLSPRHSSPPRIRAGGGRRRLDRSPTWNRRGAGRAGIVSNLGLPRCRDGAHRLGTAYCGAKRRPEGAESIRMRAVGKIPAHEVDALHERHRPGRILALAPRSSSIDLPILRATRAAMNNPSASALSYISSTHHTLPGDTHKEASPDQPQPHSPAQPA